MGNVVSLFVLGLSNGFILFLLATGLTLTMGLMRITNLAHGALFMVGGYLGLWVAQHAHNYWLGVLAGAAIAGLIGLLLETAFLRRLYGQPTAQVLLTIGFIYILQNVTQWIWSAIPAATLVPSVFRGSWPIGSVYIPIFRLVIIGIGLLMAVLLWLLQDKTRIGSVVRAGMDNREIAGALGINLKGVFTGVFVLGALIAGGFGLIGSTTMGISLGLAWDALLLSMIVVVVGGTGSIQGALVGGVLLGLLNSFGAGYFPNYAHFVSYVALIIVLLIKPSGLLGRPMAGGATANMYLEASRPRKRRPAAGLFGGAQGSALAADSATREDVALAPGMTLEWARWRMVLQKAVPYLFIVLVLVVIPPFIGSYQQSIWSRVLIFALFAMSLDLTMGYTGLVSFGHAAFLGVAGYTVGALVKHLGVTSLWVTAPTALAVVVVAALIIGYISLRVTGTYYLLVTMALGQVMFVIAVKAKRLTNGVDGLTGIDYPTLGFHFNWNSLSFYYVVFAALVVCYIILRRVVSSSFGRTLVGVCLNEERMRSLGYNTWKLKYVAIVVGGIFAGVAGIFYTYGYQHIVPQSLGLEVASYPMLMVIMGGRGTLWGPALGAAAVVLVKEYTSIYMIERWPLILGVIFVLCVMFLRGGFARYLTTAWNRWGFLRPRAARVVAAGRTEVKP